jgi:hypothetical protein
MKTVDLEIGKYVFIYDGSVKIDYLDGNVIDLQKIKPISVCIMKDGNFWIVNILTNAALLKVKRGLTDTLELLGFEFQEYMDAILAHNFLTLYLLSPERASEIASNLKDDDESN